jgi:hypothetical protein
VEGDAVNAYDLRRGGNRLLAAVDHLPGVGDLLRVKVCRSAQMLPALAGGGNPGRAALGGQAAEQIYSESARHAMRGSSCC